MIAAENEDDRKEETACTIMVDDDKNLRVHEWYTSNFDIQRINYQRRNIEWDACTQAFTRTGANGAGTVTFSFPVAVFGPEHDFVKLHNLLSSLLEALI